MIEVGASSSFNRLIKGQPELERIFRERLTVFVHNPFEPSLFTHKLSGRLKGQWAFALTFTLRIVFTFNRSDFAMLEDIGTHDQVY